LTSDMANCLSLDVVRPSIKACLTPFANMR
jgi:hypothetical protein